MSGQLHPNRFIIVEIVTGAHGIGGCVGLRDIYFKDTVNLSGYIVLIG
jgi:hypothetical protein